MAVGTFNLEADNSNIVLVALDSVHQILVGWIVFSEYYSVNSKLDGNSGEQTDHLHYSNLIKPHSQK